MRLFVFKGRHGLITGLAAVALAAGLPLTGSAPAFAADLGGTCCADLDERIAELEAATASKGNRRVSLIAYGLVNQAILFWDDGVERNSYGVGNIIDPTLFGLSGEAAIAPGWKAGYTIEVWAGDNLSEDVAQLSDEAATGLTVWQSYWFVESERFGKVSVGQASRASDGAPEVDLSETTDASFAGVQSIGGGFSLRRNDRQLAATVWGDLINHFNGDTATVVRYDSPAFAGFTVVASWGEDDDREAALYYAGEAGGWRLEGGVAVIEFSDENGVDGTGEVPSSTVAGSVSLLNQPTGLNATIAAGHRQFDADVEDADGELRTPADAKFIYAKLGWIANLAAIGPTAFFAEYGWFKDYVSAGLDAGTVSALAFTDPANICAGTGDACRVTGNTAIVWGFGVVQHIEAAEMQVYLGWRHHTADIGIVDAGGERVSAAGLQDFDTLIAGSKISF